MIIFLTDDLTFPSRVLAAAKPLGIQVRIVKPADIAAFTNDAAATLVFFDLAVCGSATSDLVHQVRERWPAAHTVAFGPHVDEALLASAESAGCELVLPRSQFSQRLAEIVGWAKP